MADSKLKCPACGKVSAPSAFQAGARGDHPLQALDVDYVGGGRAGKGGGFVYDRREMAPDEVALVLAASEAAAARLQGEAPPEARDAALAAELTKLRKTNTMLKETLRLARDEIRRLHGAP